MGAGAPILRSERLELTPVAEGDRAALQALLSLEPVRRYLLDGNLLGPEWIASVVVDSRDDFARRGVGLWAARRRGDPSLVGLVGFRDFYDPPVEELLFALHPESWGQGLATEMAGVAIAHAFVAAGRERVRASTDVPNQASLAVLLRLGMREIGREPAPAGFKWEQIHCEVERVDWERSLRQREGTKERGAPPGAGRG
jgi:RimJ/RimL family protein N-acetyltransferase